MLRDELLATARTQPVDATSMRLFEPLTVADVAALLKVSKSWVRSSSVRKKPQPNRRELDLLPMSSDFTEASWLLGLDSNQQPSG